MRMVPSGAGAHISAAERHDGAVEAFLVLSSREGVCGVEQLRCGETPGGAVKLRCISLALPWLEAALRWIRERASLQC